MKDNEEIRKLFKRYLEGKTTRNEDDVLFRYLSTGKDADKQLSDLVAEAWTNEPSARNDSLDLDEEFAAIMLKAGNKQRGRVVRLQVLKYAASVILICSVALGWYSYQKNQPQPVASIEMYSKSTAQGEKLKITLSDSTVVYLGGSSKLTWPARFVKGHYRNVRLEGEGFFEVKRDTLSPFIVYSGNIQTRVLGTSFNITAYSAEKIFSVAVRTGKVRVSENTKKGLKILSLLTHGMKLDYNNQSRLYLVNTTDENEINGWTTNRFVFNDADLQLMLGKLERYYKVRFDLKSPCLAGNRRFNATFNQKSVKEIMEQIKMMSGGQIKYKINRDTLITVWGEGCK